MKYFKIIFSLLAVSLMFSSCQDDDLGLEAMLAPSNMVVNTDISTDGSGVVEFMVSADNAFTYQFNFGDGTTGTSQDGSFTKRFNKNGLNTYLVTVVAYGKGGISSSKLVEVEVESDFSDPATKQFLTGGSTKTWYVAAFQPGHLGVGPNSGENFNNPVYYTAGTFEKAGSDASSCFYTDELIFSTTGEDNFTYVLDNNGAAQDNPGRTFFNGDYVGQFGGPTGDGDQCIEFDTGGQKTVTLAPASSGVSSSTGTQIEFSNDGFMSYYIGASTYEVLSIDDNNMYVRAVMGNNPDLAWYLKFTTTSYADQQTDGDGGDAEEAATFTSQFQEILWSDEFDGDALDTANWNYEIGNGDNGWGNGEAQYYTDSPDNVKVQDGNLVITAKRESESGFDFTSARITTKDNFEFTYGRVEVRAKLPAGEGTWPAIWMLGEAWPEESWPGVGEMDIMEFAGNQPNRISSALHFPGNSGGNPIVGDVTNVEDATTEFHIYEVEWTEDKISFFMDGVAHLEFDNDDSVPFQKDFYLLLNVAMGGSFGGAIAGDFQESSMEIDYVKVYQ